MNADDAESCPFCERKSRADDLIADNDLAVAFPDAFPISPGHSLVVARRHEPDFFALTHKEREATWHLADEVRAILAERLRADAFNIGINAGPAAGQTVAHAHIHVIPRFKGDVDDPRGGIRGLIPGRTRYWDQ